MSFFQSTLEFPESLTTSPATEKKRFYSSTQVSERSVKVRVQDADSSSTREDRDRKALPAPREAETLCSEHMHCWAGPRLLCPRALWGAAPLCHALLAPMPKAHAAPCSQEGFGDRIGKLRASRSCFPSDLSSS